LAVNVNFDTPPSSTDYDVIASGTVAGWSTGHVMVTQGTLVSNLPRLLQSCTDLLHSSLYFPLISANN